MSARPLRIAWIGAGPGSQESGGVPGVAAELLLGLVELGHRVDCYLPGTARALPQRLVEAERLSFTWGTIAWRWDRWYNRTRLGSFAAGLLWRALGSLRLRRVLARQHAAEPYDVIYQFSSIEALAMPRSLRRAVPLVIHPETHIAGELRFLLAERRLALRGQPAHLFVLTAAMMLPRVMIQRRRIRGARLLVCISRAFRDHLVRDYRFPVEKTVVIPNPVRLARFPAGHARPSGRPPTVLVLGRISARTGVEHVIATARLLLERGADVRIRVVGGPSLWSDYTSLLEDLPVENSEFVGRIAPADIPAELARSDVLFQPSKYEPFGLTVGEALSAGVPVVATTEVGAAEGVDREVVSVLEPGDVDGFADAIGDTLARLAESPAQIHDRARAEAARLFAPHVVCRQISDALCNLVDADERV
jgi:glycosyltransferase involved in cell wall biosynthesis